MMETTMDLVKKRTSRSVVVLGGALLLSTLWSGTLVAQQPDGPPAQGQMQGPPQGGRGGMNPERRLEVMKSTLNLTPEQTTQVKAIMDDGRAKMEALRSNTALSQQDRRAQMMTMRGEEQAKFKAVLTPDQFTKLQAMEARQRERMQDGRGPGGPGGPPPPDGPPSPPAPPQ